MIAELTVDEDKSTLIKNVWHKCTSVRKLTLKGRDEICFTIGDTVHVLMQMCNL